MAYDKNMRGGYRPDERGDWRDNRETGRGEWRGGRDRGERGFFERAGDEISSWFGDEDAERRRQMDERSERGRHDERGRYDRPSERGSWLGGGRDRDRDEQREQDRGGWFAERSAQWDRGRDRDERYGDSGSSRYRESGRESFGRPSSGWQNQSPRQSFGRDDYDRPSRDDEYRPYAGDYGRSGSYGRGDDDRQRGRMTGSAMGAVAGSAVGSQFGDPHYHEWRQRQIEELDRDYDEYRREHQSKFANDFTGWRTQRQSKRQMLGQVREHMDVVGSDDEHVGTVDKVQDDRIILTKNDPEAGGVHRSLSCSIVDRIEGDKLILSTSAQDAKSQLREERGFQERNAADQRGSSVIGQPQRSNAPGIGEGEGPHNLERSFQGTYR